MLQRLAAAIEANWYRPSPGLNWLFLPLWLIAAPLIIRKRNQAQRQPAATLNTPVVVIGNITVGGTGKTPLITYLVDRVRKLGYEPGIISRGYGGNSKTFPLIVAQAVPAQQCGDEPKLLQQRLNCPVVVDPIRKRAAELLNTKVDIIFSDDGLQHYALGRDAEILVVDGQRQFGNGWLLPVGPLREPLSRAEQVDVRLDNGSDFTVVASNLINAHNGECRSLELLSGQKVHAVAGIGNPSRFFDTLQQLGAEVIRHEHADHYQFKPQDLQFGDDYPVIMTEKDWVKCSGFTDLNMWYLAVDAQLEDSAATKIDQLLLSLLAAGNE